ncbi:MAG: ABC transporter ATP-binding protein [Bacillota bacterium]|nr:ABC transporter ATP-binding protein [Bacillota bacterium]
MNQNRVTLLAIAKQALAGQHFLLLLLVVFMVGSVLAEVVPPFIVSKVVDYNIGQKTTDGLWFWAAVYLLAIFGARIITFLQTYITVLIGQKALLRLRSMMADYLARLPILYYDRTPVGDIVSRMTNDVEQINVLFTTGVIALVTDLFKIIGVVSAMFAINSSLALLTLLALPFVYGATEYFRRNIRGAQRASRVWVGAINTYLQESWRGFKLIKQFNRAGRFLERFEVPQQRYLEAANKAATFNAYFPGVQKTIEAITTGLVVWMAAYKLAVSPALSLGAVVAFSQLITRLFAPVQEISDQLQTFQQAMAGVDRVAGFLREQPDEGIAETPAVAESAVSDDAMRLDHVEFGYGNSIEILHGISIGVRRRERVAIVGRTGAGKTSIISLAAGLYRPWRGTVSITGKNPATLTTSERRHVIGVVPQTVYVAQATVAENISLGDPAITREQMVDVCHRVGLDAVIEALPSGLDTVLGRGGQELSHGQNQLLCLARAMVCAPPILLLDEPTSGIDSETERAIARTLAESQDMALVIVSHRPTNLSGIDRVIVIGDGRVIQEGTQEELENTPGWYASMREIRRLGWTAS